MAQPATVLILADIGDPERAALEAACGAAGFSASIEPSAEAATQKLTAKRFDALVVHLGTPGAALASMRARGKLLRTRIPVLALVDTDDDATFSRAYRAGADEVLLLRRPDWLTGRLRALPRSAIPQPGNARGDAVVADADRTRAEVVERVLRDAGFRVEVAVDGFSTRLQAGRPSLKVAVIDASLDDVPSLILQAKGKGARCAWVVRARPEQLDEIRQKLVRVERVSVLSAYSPPDDVLFEVNRLIEPRPSDGRGEGRLLQAGVLGLRWADQASDDIGYSYNWSATGIFVRTLAAPAGTKVTLRLTPPGTEEKLTLECELVWRREFGATRKEPVPAGFALRVVGGDLSAWARVCPRTSSLPPRAAAPAPESLGTEAVKPSAVVAAPGDVDIKPRDSQSSVEAMLASVLSESAADEDEPGAAPLSIDGGTVVALHADTVSDAALSDDQITKVQNSPSERPPVAPYTAERARQELLATALDASKTPLAVPLGLERSVSVRPQQRPTTVIPRPNDPSRLGAGSRTDQRTSLRPASSAAASSLEPRRKSDRPPPEAGGLDLSDITPASIGFDLSEDGRIIEEVRRLPPVEERRPGITARVSTRPSLPARPSMQSPSRGGTLAGTGGPAPFELMTKERTPEPAPPTPARKSDPAPPTPARKSDPAPPIAARKSEPAPPIAARKSEPAPPIAARKSEPAPPSSARASEALAPPSSEPPVVVVPRASDRPTATPGSIPMSDGGPESMTVPRGGPLPSPGASQKGASGAVTATIETVAATGVAAETERAPGAPPHATTRVVADPDASATGDTMRPAAAGLPESTPPPPLAGFGPSPYGGSPAVPRAGLHDSTDDDQDFPARKRKSSLAIWIVVAAVLGGGAALFATPSLRRHAPGAKVTEPAALPAPTPTSVGLEKASDKTTPVVPGEPAAAPPTTASATVAASATAAPAATAIPEAPSAPSSLPTAGTTSAAAPAGADSSGAEVDPAALAALAPGQGYLYVASPLATNVFLYGNLAGTTNQRITSKCGPRFIRLGTTLGNWQGEGQVQIVKCGALTRIEMGN